MAFLRERTRLVRAELWCINRTLHLSDRPRPRGIALTLVQGNGCVIRMTRAGSIEIQANVSVEVTAPLVEVSAPISTFSGLVKCQTLITEAFVISPTYTPGAGNIW